MNRLQAQPCILSGVWCCTHHSPPVTMCGNNQHMIRLQWRFSITSDTARYFTQFKSLFHIPSSKNSLVAGGLVAGGGDKARVLLCKWVIPPQLLEEKCSEAPGQLHSEPLTIAQLSQHLNQPHTKNLSEVRLLQTQATLSLQWEIVLRLKFCGILIECNHHDIVNLSLSIRCSSGQECHRSPRRGSSSSPRCCCFDKLLFLKHIHVELAVGHRRPAPPLHWSTPLFVFLVHVRYVKMIDNWREMWRYWTLFWLFTPSPDTSPCLWTNPSPLKSNHGN